MKYLYVHEKFLLEGEELTLAAVAALTAAARHDIRVVIVTDGDFPADAFFAACDKLLAVPRCVVPRGAGFSGTPMLAEGDTIADVDRAFSALKEQA